MKNLINLTFLFFVLFAGYNVSAQDVIFESNLRKLSIALRGKVPTLVEINKYREIKATSTANQALQLASTDFVNSKDFVGKFSNNVSNLFRVFQSPLNNHKYLDYENPPELNTGNPPSVFNFLVQEIFLKDLPWTELLVKSEYYSTDIESNIDFNVSNRRFFATAQTQVAYSPTLSQSDFLAAVTTGLSFTPVYDKYTYQRGDLRIAGILTTPDFIKRYVSTGVNKNRKRAAAVFRTLLCNDMVAAIPASKDGVDEEKKVALLGVDEYTEDDIINHVKGLQVHGQNPECMKCHRQLDPLGELFGLIGETLPQDPSPGGLIFKTESGAEINIQNLNGLGELGGAIAQQEDFYSCQVRHFWKWVHGGHRLLTPKVEIDLVAKFKEFNLKPKSFVKFLVDQPDFYQSITYSEAQIVTFGAFKTLKKCQSCHNVQEETPEMQNINWFEIIDDKAHPKRPTLINRSLKQITKGHMPPPESKADFSDAELENLTKWLKDYKTNFDGQ